MTNWFQQWIRQQQDKLSFWIWQWIRQQQNNKLIPIKKWNVDFRPLLSFVIFIIENNVAFTKTTTKWQQQQQ